MTAEAISHINFQRIEWCCREVNTSLARLHSALRIPLAKLQQGPLTYNQLKKVGNYFGYTPLFFLEEGLPQAESVHSPAFRTLASQSANQSVPMDTKLQKLIKKVEWHRDIYISLLEDLDEPPAFEPPQLHGDIEQQAASVRKWLGLATDHQYSFKTYRQRVESKGILVFQRQFPNKDVAGFAIQHQQVPTIFIRKTTAPMQTFTLFHALGHLLLHDTSCFDCKQNLAPDTTKEIEREANLFARNCLIPSQLLHDSTPQIPASPEEYSDTSVAAAKKPIQDTALSPDPRDMFGERYVGTVLSAHHAGLVTLNKVSNYLDHLKISDIKKLERSL